MTAKHIAAVLAAYVLLCTTAGAQEVSKPVADAINARKYYMKLSGVQTSGGESTTMKLELAQRGEVTMSRVDVSGFKVVTLSDGGTSFMLDEASKFWRQIPAGEQPLPSAFLKFSRHGKCTLNGKPFYFDEYTAPDGTVLSCYYESSKVAAIELAKGKDKLGPMNLESFTSAIPSNMYFCLPAGWKGAPGASAKPPVCSSPWHETESPVELACGHGNGKINVSGKVESSDQPDGPALAQAEEAALDEYCAEGVEAAVDELIAEMEGMSDDEMKNHLLIGSAEVGLDLATDSVSKETVERAIARCALCPHSITFANAGAAVQAVSGPEKAIPFYESAEKLSPGNPAVAAEIVNCYIELGNHAKAESKARTALSKTPDASVLWQQLAAICFQKENWREAARALFKSMSLGYFDDISASMCLSLYTHVVSGMTEDPAEYNFYSGLREIFSDENLAYLEAAASCGHGDIRPSEPPSYDVSWNMIYGNVEHAHEAMSENVDEYLELSKELDRKADKTLESTNGQIYLMMGAKNSLYQFLCGQKTKGSDIILNLCDSREFWANYMTMLYYQAMISWTSGSQGKFRLPSREIADENIKQTRDAENQKLENISKEETAAQNAVKGKTGYDIFLKEYTVNMTYAKQKYDVIKPACNQVLKYEADYYKKEVEPLLDDYYNKASIMAQYISEKQLQTYFLDMMMSTMYKAKAEVLMAGAGAGSEMDGAMAEVEMWQQAIAELKGAKWKSEREQYLEHKRELEQMDAYHLYDFNEEEKNDGGLEVSVGCGPDCGRMIRFSFGTDGFSVEMTDKRNGVTTSFGADGLYTKVDYVMAFDSQQAELNRNMFDARQKAANKKQIAEFILGRIPVVSQIFSGYSNIQKAKKFMADGTTSHSMEDILARDPQGHMVHGTCKTTEKEFLGGNATYRKEISVVNGRRTRKDYLGKSFSDPASGIGFSVGAYGKTSGRR